MTPSPVPTLYGITNCDTVKRARAWFAQQSQAVVFHDFKKLGVPEARLDAWLAAAGWQTLLNRKGSTWRQLDDETRESVAGPAEARVLMQAQASVIKRPVVEWADGRISVGFDGEAWGAYLAASRAAAVGAERL
jgi:arsenate reductase (glutaredoxin)